MIPVRYVKDAADICVREGVVETLERSSYGSERCSTCSSLHWGAAFAHESGDTLVSKYQSGNGINSVQSA